MSEPIGNGGEVTNRVVQHRPTPSLPTDTAPHISLKYSPSIGFGVFASHAIPEGTELLRSKGPAVYVIYRAFRKEVCAWCFRYERGRNWKVRVDSANKDVMNDNVSGTASGGLVFCCVGCREEWQEEYGELVLEAYASVENFVQKQSRNKGWASDALGEDNGRVPDQDDIEETWRIVEEQANFIRSLRLKCNSYTKRDAESSSTTKSSTKAQKQALAQATAVSINNTDTLFFLLSGILCASSPSAWSSLLSLNPSYYTIYTCNSTLRSITTTFLHLTAVLPPPLLTYVSRAAIEAVLARDIGNSFGIWSSSAELKSELNHQCPQSQQDDAEMLGYGIWPVASFFNHSCAPNVARRRVGRRWVFISARDDLEDEELCISYIRGEEDVLGLKDRRRRLEDSWGFTCRCQKCLDQRRQEKNLEMK